MVGSAACAGCHAPEHGAWSASLHARAMAPSDAATVASAFDGAPVPWGGGSLARPHRDGGRRWLETERPAGRHELRFVLGHRPIEQHLAAFPGGKLQALPVGFDTGRRAWFDVFPDDAREPSDWGHWTNRGMTANSQCLFCHTTAYEKGYRVEDDAYASRWTEMAVGCEACHGPGASHVAARRAGRPDGYPPPAGERRLDACATCHALRREIATGFVPGARLLDFFEPDLLDGDAYHPDGQLRQESYEWGSFAQSAMHRAGVECGACHDAHSGALLAEGDALCLGCHDARLARAEHTHHAPDSDGARCVSCHMPETVFMARDPRRDHSFPLPDPRLTVGLGIPNACDRCHGDRDARWAAEAVEGWAPGSARLAARRGRARMVAGARAGDPAVVDELLACVAECATPVWRASAARLLARFVPRPGTLEALGAALAAEPPLVRAAAAWALAEAAADMPAARERLLDAAADPVRAVRVNAAWGLRAVPPGDLAPERQATLAAVLEEWRRSMLVLAEHPETHHTLGVFHADRSEDARAEAAYRTALRLAPDAVPSRYNLAMLHARRGDVRAAEAALLELRRRAPGFAPAAYALGLLYGHEGRWRDAVVSLRECLELDPAHPGALHDLAHAHVQLGQGNIATVVLQTASRHPATRREALRALVSVSLALGDAAAARRWAREAADDDPELTADARVQALLRGD
jgi:predicted CXXCH cytochrome family protein